MFTRYCKFTTFKMAPSFFDTVCWLRHAVLFSVVIVISGCTTIQSSAMVKSGSAMAQTKSASVDLFLMSVDAQQAYQQSRWLDAVRLYQEIVEHTPSDAIAWFRLANTYAQQGAFERAVHAYEQSLSHDAEQPKAWFNLSTVYLLNAQSSMRQSQVRMRPGDPARDLIEDRLRRVGTLLHGRMEESDFSSVRSLR